MNSYKFPVTQDCIDDGIRARCDACPVALAMIEAGMSSVDAGLTITRFIDRRGVRREVPTPWEAGNFMREFDAGRYPGPFTLELNV